MKNRERPIYFVLGTRAQFIKVAPVLHEMRNQGLDYKLIYTAQHQEKIDDILRGYNLSSPDKVLFHDNEASTRTSFAKWFLVLLYKTIFRAKKIIPEPGIVLTHGDTFTAWLAALMGKLSGSKVAHIESGLRSYNIFSPFPEELSRILTFALSDIYFCSSQWAVNNLKRFRGHKINLGANTLLDGVRYALSAEINLDYDFLKDPFALVSIHRYENIYSKRFTEFIIPCLFEISKNIKLIFVLHPSTRERLKKINLYNELNASPQILLYDRFGFTEWIQLCNSAEFVITDGGSNQEELSYLGTPTLLFRNETERYEGLSQNVVISKFNRKIIKSFIQNISHYRNDRFPDHIHPTQEIIQYIRNYEQNKSKKS